MPKKPPIKRRKIKKSEFKFLDRKSYRDALIELYKKTDAFYYIPLYSLLKRLFKEKFRKRLSIVEIGYREEKNFIGILKHMGFKSIIGYDLRGREMKSKGLQLLVGDVLDIDKKIERESQDVIIARGVFETCGWRSPNPIFHEFPEENEERLKQIFSKVFSVLKPGGVLILAPISYIEYPETVKEALSHFGEVFSYKTIVADTKEELLVIRKFKKSKKA